MWIIGLSLYGYRFNNGMRLDALELSLYEHGLSTLIMTTNFFGKPTIRILKALKLRLLRLPQMLVCLTAPSFPLVAFLQGRTGPSMPHSKSQGRA